MKTYRVCFIYMALTREYFQCYADDWNHAAEQCENAYPGCDILAIERQT